MLISLVHVVLSGQNHPKPVRWWKISQSPTSLPWPKPSEACKRIFVERMIFRFSSPISSVVPAVGLQDMAGNNDSHFNNLKFNEFQRPKLRSPNSVVKETNAWAYLPPPNTPSIRGVAGLPRLGASALGSW